MVWAVSDLLEPASVVDRPFVGAVRVERPWTTLWAVSLAGVLPPVVLFSGLHVYRPYLRSVAEWGASIGLLSVIHAAPYGLLAVLAWRTLSVVRGHEGRLSFVGGHEGRLNKVGGRLASTEAETVRTVHRPTFWATFALVSVASTTAHGVAWAAAVDHDFITGALVLINFGGLGLLAVVPVTFAIRCSIHAGRRAWAFMYRPAIDR